MIKYKKRNETNYFYVVKKDLNGKTLDEVIRDSRKAGEFDTGFHYIVYANGLIDSDRDKECVAGWNLDNNTDSIYVLVDTTGKLSDSQKAAVASLSRQFNKLKMIEV